MGRPEIYYSGHGNSNGSWCFKDGKTWAISQIKALVPADADPLLYIDCCYAGKWFDDCDYEMCLASCDDRTATDNCFSTYMWLKCSCHPTLGKLTCNSCWSKSYCKSSAAWYIPRGATETQPLPGYWDKGARW